MDHDLASREGDLERERRPERETRPTLLGLGRGRLRVFGRRRVGPHGADARREVRGEAVDGGVVAGIQGGLGAELEEGPRFEVAA